MSSQYLTFPPAVSSLASYSSPKHRSSEVCCSAQTLLCAHSMLGSERSATPEPSSLPSGSFLQTRSQPTSLRRLEVTAPPAKFQTAYSPFKPTKASPDENKQGKQYTSLVRSFTCSSVISFGSTLIPFKSYQSIKKYKHLPCSKHYLVPRDITIINTNPLTLPLLPWARKEGRAEHSCWGQGVGAQPEAMGTTHGLGGRPREAREGRELQADERPV